MRPPARHAAFFSSLKQVENRLASESSKSRVNKNPAQNLLFSSKNTSTEATAVDDLSSPIYLNYHQPNTEAENSLRFQESEPPQEFLSHSIEFPPAPNDPSQSASPKHDPIVEPTYDDDIDRLIDLLGLLGCGEGEGEKGGDLKSMSCFCNGGFYSKIAGVRGPKCDKERKRLDEWIRHYYCNHSSLSDGGGRRDPLILAHLLLAKAACLNDDGEEIEFPVTVDEFLHHDPPAGQHKQHE